METGSDLVGGRVRLRRWRSDDLHPLVAIANNPRIAGNLRNLFPYPYRLEDGIAWLDLAVNQLAETAWAIEENGALAGGIALLPQADINAGAAEIGYWLGEPFWGRGLATDAVRTLTRHALSELNYRRLFATVLAGNVPSCRVLEKSRYRKEGILRRAAIKNGMVLDQILFARVDTDQ
jgi:RimJ/RimL family protein N-acetyltransferase